MPTCESPSLINLLHQLADEIDYPDRNELLVAETVEEFCSVLLPRIFEYYEKTKDRSELITKLQACCVMTMPAGLRRIAKWRVPGIVYTHIDGVMQEALKAAGRAISVVNVADRPLAASAEASRDDAPLTLFNLRGSLEEVESLILTDRDHDELIQDRLERANTDVVNLFKKTFGRAVLFIGVSPLDPALRRLARLYLEAPRKLQGPRYFVVQHASAGDKAYWKDFDVQWIESDPATVIEALDAALGAA